MGLNEIVSGKARKVLYAVFAFVGVGLGATQVAYSAAEAGQPMWLTVALAVFAFVGTAFGFTAASNITPDDVGTSDMLPMETHTYYGVGRQVVNSGGVLRAPAEQAQELDEDGPFGPGEPVPGSTGITGRPASDPDRM